MSVADVCLYERQNSCFDTMPMFAVDSKRRLLPTNCHCRFKTSAPNSISLLFSPLEYKEGDNIPKNTSVIVVRVPLTSAQQRQLYLAST